MQSNRAFIADGAGSTLGGLLGSSALTTYVESAAAVREGGRTGLTAVVCSCFFFARYLCNSHAHPVPDRDLGMGMHFDNLIDPGTATKYARDSSTAG